MARPLMVVICLLFWTVNVTCVSAQSAPKNRKNRKSKAVAVQVELLKDFSESQQSVRGQWIKSNSGIRSDGSQDALVQFPVSVLGSYELELEFTRVSGKGAISLSCPAFPKALFIELSGWDGKYSGLSYINLKLANELPIGQGLQVSPSGVTTGVKQKLNVQVQQRADVVAVAAMLDGVPFIQWQGPLSTVNGWPASTPHNPYLFGLRTSQAVYEIHRLALTPDVGSQFHECEETWDLPWAKVKDKPPANVPASWMRDGKAYFVSETTMPFPNAHALAAQLGGRLLTISSQEEFDFVIDNGLGQAYFVDGWHNNKSGWRDSHNKPLKIIGKWGPGQPNYPPFETQLGIVTSALDAGLHDYHPNHFLHACIEWGNE